MKRNTKFLVSGGVIAALYVVLTVVSAAFGLSSGAVQIRISEALCILPAFTPAAVPGLFIGCLLSNLLCGGNIWDIIFGSLATLAGAAFTYLLRRNRWLAALPPIITNAIVVPLVLTFAMHAAQSFWLLVLTVAAGEIISCGVIGQLLYSALNKHRDIFT